MSKAVEEFTNLNITVDTIFAEDYVMLDKRTKTHDWISEMKNFYSESRGGKLWDAQKNY